MKGDEAQELPAIRAGETEQEWLERLRLLQESKETVKVVVEIPLRTYRAYARLNRLVTAYEIGKSFNRVVNRALEMKLEEFLLLVQAVEAELKHDK